MAANDLTTLSDVKAWLGRTDTNSDMLLAALITRASRQICSWLQRPLLLPHSVSEMRGGTGGSTLVLKEWPVLAVSSVIVSGIVIPQATAHGPGWTLESWNGVPPGRPQALSLRGHAFGSGLPALRDFSNVVVTYESGYRITNEPQVVSSGAATITAPFGAWACDAGVTYADGAPLTPVSASPAVGQYMLDATAGKYDFNAGDNGASVLISYGFVPSDLADACIEIVAERYKYAQRIGEKTHSLGGNETVSFDTTRFTPLVAAMLEPYRRIAPL